MQALPSRLFPPGIERVAHLGAACLNGEVNDGGRPAHGGGARAGFEVVGGSGAAEGHIKMSVSVDAAGQQHHSGRVDQLVRRHSGDAGADFVDRFAFDQDIRGERLFRRDHRAVLNQRAHQFTFFSQEAPAMRSSHDWEGRLIHPLHRDATLDWTHQRAEVAADAFVFVHTRNACQWRGIKPAAVARGPVIELGDWRHRDLLMALLLVHRGSRMTVAADAIQVDALVRAVPASGVAECAADALLFVDAGDDLIVEVEVLPLLDARHGQPAKVFDARESFFAHPVRQAVSHVFDDAIAIVHYRRAHLHAAATEQDEFSGIAPVRDSADTREGQDRFRIGLNLLHHVQRDRLYRWPAVTAMRRFSVHVRAGNETYRDQCR